MKSSSGECWRGLDHIRALAVLVVFVWHFLYGRHGEAVPFQGLPSWGPLVLFDEGQFGIALFVALSGYLFARLLDGNTVRYRYFAWNRLLRLMPMVFLTLFISTALAAIKAGDLRVGYWYLTELPARFMEPGWKSRAWFFTLPLQLYLLLPLLQFLRRRWPPALFLLVAGAVLLRAIVHAHAGEVQSFASWTVFGHLDQFVLGYVGYHWRALVAGRHAVIAAVFAAFVALYSWFDAQGGYYLQPAYPSPSPAWIVLPMLEGVMAATLIAWYDSSFAHGPGPVSNLVAKVGECSWSLYMLHFFLVFDAARCIQLYVLDLSNFYVALLAACGTFLLMIPVGYLGTRFVERPFLALRRPYLVNVASADESKPVAEPVLAGFGR